MFEKEAEEYATENYENCLYDDFPYANDSRAREQSFKDGAEFGYNKAKEELKINKDDIRKAKLNSIETFEEKNEYLREVSNWAIFNEDISVMFWCFVQRGDIYAEQLNKANEWHYVKDGKLPKECENVWCYCRGPGIKFCCVGHTIVNGDNKVKWWANNKSEELRVIAWKEIVLPELKESE